MINRGRIILTLILAGVGVLLSALIIYEILHPPQLAPLSNINQPDPTTVDASGQPLAAFEVPPLADYADIVERPLFLESRRPPDPEEEPVAETTPTGPNTELTFTLQGVMLTPQSMMALLRVEQQNKVVRLRVGDTFETWQLDAIREDGVSLRTGEQVVNLPLIRNKPVPKRRPRARQRTNRRAAQAQRAARADPDQAPQTEQNNNNPDEEEPDNAQNQPEAVATPEEAEARTQ